MAEQLQLPSVSYAPDLFRLDDRVALITGGAGLLGRRYCEALLQSGARVIIGDLDAARSAALAAELSETLSVAATDPPRRQMTADVRVIGLGLDVTDPDSAQNAVRAAVRAFGRLDILINNAALTVRGGSERLSPRDYFAPFEDYKLDVWDQALNTNLTGMLLCAQAAGRQMLEQTPTGGVVVNISSTYGVVAPDQRLYSGVKSPYADSGFQHARQLRGYENRRARLDALPGDLLGEQEHPRQCPHAARRFR